MTTEPETREYYKLIFPASIKYGDTLRVMEWRPAWRTERGHRPAGWIAVRGRVTGIKRFGKAWIITYTGRHGGTDYTQSTLYYPGQYACLLLSRCYAQPH